MKIREIIVFVFIIVLCSCSKTHDINEEDLKNFVIEYDNALSENWSLSDTKLNKNALKKFLASDFLVIDGGKLSWNDWYIYNDDIQIIKIEKIHKGEFEYNKPPLGKESYRVYYERIPAGKIINNKIIPIENISDFNIKKLHKEECCEVTVRNSNFYVAYYNYSVNFWVKEKHLPALIKRKGLVVEK